MKIVAIVNAPEAAVVGAMFKQEKYNVRFISDIPGLSKLNYDLVCFVGGEDISPSLYGETNTGQSYSNPYRDLIEHSIYNAIPKEIPKVGICRGGQFLNVMNGGGMIQHVDGHNSCIHEVESPSHSIWLNSDHHQVMLSSESAELVAWEPNTNGYEVLWYPETKCLCFQPHPEWDHQPTRDYFFELLNHYFKL